MGIVTFATGNSGTASAGLCIGGHRRLLAFANDVDADASDIIYIYGYVKKVSQK